MVEKKGSWRQRVCRCACIIERKAASFLLTKDDVESIGFLTNFLHKILVFYQNFTRKYVCRYHDSTSLSSSATRSLKANKASSLSSARSVPRLLFLLLPLLLLLLRWMKRSPGNVKERVGRSVGVVAATPMPVRSFVRLVLPMISRVFMHFVVFRLDHQKAEKKTTRKRVCGFDLSLFSLVSRTRKVRKRSKNVLTKRFFYLI